MLNQLKEQITLDKIALWLGQDQINLRLAEEQIQILTQENTKLNTILSTCKCQKEINDSK